MVYLCTVYMTADIEAAPYISFHVYQSGFKTSSNQRHVNLTVLIFLEFLTIHWGSVFGTRFNFCDLLSFSTCELNKINSITFSLLNV